jgi:predicted RecA/RadA family phage recombinase
VQLAGDIVDIVAYGTFSVASLNADNLDSGTVPSARISGAYTGITNLTMSGDLTVDTDTLKVNSTNNRVGIGTSSPDEKLNVVGNIRAEEWSTPKLQLKRTGNNAGNGYIECLGADDSVDYKIAFAEFAGAMSFDVGGSERMRIDSSGHVIAPYGVTLGTAVGTYNASNTLDDYEEGEYNITATDSGGGATITLKSYTNRLRYTKIGSIVHVQGRVQADTVTGTYSGTLNINLPFASADLVDTGDSVGTVIGVYADYDSGASPACWVTEGSSLLEFRTSRYSNQVGNLTLGVNDYLVFQITYVTN